MTAKDLNLPTDSTKIDSVPVATAPRKPGSEVKRPGSEIRKALPAAAAPPKPAAPAPRPAPAEAVSDDDSEKLLREYAERQKTQLKKVAGERDGFRARAEQQAREIADLRKQLDAASKADDVIKDLQGKLDAALLSNTMLSDENAKLKARLPALEATQKKFEEKTALLERNLAEAQKSLAAQADARKEADARIASALQALQPRAAAPPPAPKK